VPSDEPESLCLLVCTSVSRIERVHHHDALCFRSMFGTNGRRAASGVALMISRTSYDHFRLCGALFDGIEFGHEYHQFSTSSLGDGVVQVPGIAR
jgi:hypothetical protein